MECYYKLRIDTDNKEELCQRLKKYTDVYLISVENIGTDNPHCHVYYETTHKSLTIRQMIRKFYGSGNGVYSMKQLDERLPIEYISYCIKDDNYIHTLDPKFIQECKDWNTRVKEEIKIKKENKKTVLQLCEEWINENIDTQECWIRTLYRPPFSHDVPETKSLLHYKHLVLKYHMVTDRLIRKFQIESIAMTIFLKHNPTQQWVIFSQN